MSGFFHLSQVTQELIYAMTHVSRFGASASDRGFASRMVSASHDPRWQPDEVSMNRMQHLAHQKQSEVAL